MKSETEIRNHLHVAQALFDALIEKRKAQPDGTRMSMELAAELFHIQGMIQTFKLILEIDDYAEAPK